MVTDADLKSQEDGMSPKPTKNRVRESSVKQREDIISQIADHILRERKQKLASQIDQNKRTLDSNNERSLERKKNNIDFYSKKW